MKGLKSKILIILVCIVTCFSLTACNVTGVWSYFMQSFPETGLFPQNPETEESAPQTPFEPNGNININQGTINSSSGGLADVVEKILPSVVEVTVIYDYLYNGEIYQIGSRGSGVIVNKQSDSIEIITNEHVVADGADFTENGKYYSYQSIQIVVKLNSGREYSATRLYKNAQNDLALLKVEKSELGEEYDSVTLASVLQVYSITEGEKVLAIGNPLGTLGGTVTSGIISATEREQMVESNLMTLIQMDASVNPGNSGGGLFNEDGKLIGIVNAKISQTGVEGIGFAIPIIQAIEVFNSAGYLSNLVCERGE